MRKNVIATILLTTIFATAASGALADGGAVVKMLEPTRLVVDFEKVKPFMPRVSQKVLRKELRRERKALSRSKTTERSSFDAPQAFGLQRMPYTIARVEIPLDSEYASNYQKIGKVFAISGGFGGSTISCTGALIRPGIVVTAASCVSKFGGGSEGVAFSASFVPAWDSSLVNEKPFGVWTAKAIIVPKVFTDGTDYCPLSTSKHPGIACVNDLALIVLQAQNGERIGDKVGYFNYATGFAHFVKYENKDFNWAVVADLGAQVTVLGYPVVYDKGTRLVRSDSMAFTLNELNSRLTIGSPFSGGANGSPWIVNFGTPPAPKPGYNLGKYSEQNIVGVTNSHTGKVNGNNYKRLIGTKFGRTPGYSFSAPYSVYGYGNIGYLMTKACFGATTKDAC